MQLSSPCPPRLLFHLQQLYLLLERFQSYASILSVVPAQLHSWHQAGLTFLIIEHNMDVIMSLCEQVWVLAEGKNLAVGTPQEIQMNPTVLAAYLGSGEE